MCEVGVGEKNAEDGGDGPIPGCSNGSERDSHPPKLATASRATRTPFQTPRFNVVTGSSAAQCLTFAPVA